MNCIDHEYYFSVFGGKMEEEDFERALPTAKAYLTFFTHNRIKEMSSNIKDTLCAMCDTIHEFKQRSQGGVKKSESIDGYSVTYTVEAQDGVANEKLLERKLFGVARVYLSGTGLLYLGVSKC